MVHEDHAGIVRMKTIARGYVWWPRMDGDLGELAKSCRTCQGVQKAPAEAPLRPWI